MMCDKSWSIQDNSIHSYKPLIDCQRSVTDKLHLTHGGLDSGDVWLGKAGSWSTLGGVNSWVGGDGGGATSAVRVLNVPSTVTASATALL